MDGPNVQEDAGASMAVATAWNQEQRGSLHQVGPVVSHQGGSLPTGKLFKHKDMFPHVLQAL